MDTVVVDSLTQFPPMDLVSFQTLLGVVATGLVIPIVKMLRPIIAKIPLMNPSLLNTVVCFGMVFGCKFLFYPELEYVEAMALAGGMKILTGDGVAMGKKFRNGTN